MTTRTQRHGRGRIAGIAGHRRRNQIAGQFSAVLIETLDSPAWRVLSLSARRVLDRVRIELGRHAGHESARLPVSYDDFEAYGIERHCIAAAIREAVALGFLRITREGRAGNAEHRQVAFYQLTFVNNTDGEPLTHEWKGSRLWLRHAQRRRLRATSPANRMESQCVEPAPLPVWETPPQTADFMVENPALMPGEKPPLLSICRVGGRAVQAVGRCVGMRIAIGILTPFRPATATADRQHPHQLLQAATHRPTLHIADQFAPVCARTDFLVALNRRVDQQTKL